MAALWTAFDLTSLSSNVEAGLIIGVTLTLGFIGFKFIKRTGKVL